MLGRSSSHRKMILRTFSEVRKFIPARSFMRTIRNNYPSPPSDSYEEFKRSFMAPSDLQIAEDSSIQKYSGESLGSAVPSLDTISQEVLSIMLDETVRRQDGETMRMLLVEARVLGKLNPELLQPTFEKCFENATDPSNNLHAYTQEAQYRLQRGMENASFLLQISLSSPEYRILVTEAQSQQLLGWLSDHGKWYQAAIAAEYMVREGHVFKGEREVFFIVSGLMKNSLGVARALKLLETIVSHRRSDLSELFAYSKMNRYSLSMSGKHSNRRDLDRSPLEGLSNALLSQMREHAWFSFSASKMLVALACGSGHHDIAVNFVKSAVSIAEDAGADGDGKLEGGRLNQLAQLLSRSLSGTDGTEIRGGNIPNNYGASNRINLVSILRAASQGAGVAMTDKSSFTGNSLESPLSQTIIDISARIMAEHGRASRFDRGDSDAVDNMTKTRPLFLTGPLKHVDFFKMYWVLCHRVQRGGNRQIQKSGTMSGAHNEPTLEAEAISDSYPRQRYDVPETDADHTVADVYLQKSYNQLVTFMHDIDANTMTVSPQPGYHRRAFRYMCDALGLRHKVVELLEEKTGGVGDTYGVRVWKLKTRMRHKYPPSLNDLLKQDSRRLPHLRRFDSHLQHWNQLEEYLTSLSPEALCAVCDNTVAAMASGYPSAEWSLLLAQMLKEANISYPATFIKNILKMSGNRSDIYGLLEALYMNQESISMGVNNANPRNKKISLTKAPVVISEDGFIYSEDEARAAGLSTLKTLAERAEDDRMAKELNAAESMTSSVMAPFQAVLSGVAGEAVDRSNTRRTSGYLRASDWNRVCASAYNCRLAELPEASFREAYTEVMGLLNTAGVELEDGVMRTLLRFLVYTDPDAELARRIIRRLHKDKSLKITHIECTALTYACLRRLKGSGGFGVSIARPMYKAENYLFVYPAGLTQMVDSVVNNADVLGRAFLIRFEDAWANANSQNGRNELYALLMERLSNDSPTRQELVEMESGETRECLLMLSVYASYLVGTQSDPNDSHAYRRAFELMFAAEQLMQDAEKAHQRSRMRSPNLSHISDFDEDQQGTGEEPVYEMEEMEEEEEVENDVRGGRKYRS